MNAIGSLKYTRRSQAEDKADVSRSVFRILLLFILTLSTGLLLFADQALFLEITVHARELAPGEPVRVQVRTAEPLSSLSGTFLGKSIVLHPADSSTWFGWTMIGLDQDPGISALEFTATTTTGTPVTGTLAVTIVPKEFPEENLSVSSKYVEPPAEVQRRLEKERSRLKKIYLRVDPVQVSGKPFVRPVPGKPTSIFGMRRLFNGKPRSPHPGLDLRANTGTPVSASGDGVVVLAQDLYYSGNTVILDHGGNLFTLYAHLSRIDVKENSAVKAGVVIGLSGATGRVTGPHLHWGAKIGDQPFDPTALLDPVMFDE